MDDIGDWTAMNLITKPRRIEERRRWKDEVLRWVAYKATVSR